MDVLSLLRSRFAERTRNAAETVSTAARKVANGQNVDHTALEAAMVATATTVDAFAELVDLHKRRAAWRADYDRLKDAATKRDKVNATIEREAAAFEELRQKHAEKMSRLQADYKEVSRLVERGEAARHELLAVDNVPAPAAQTLREAHDNLATASEAVSAATRAIREANDGIKSEEEWIARKDEAGDNHMSSKGDHELALKRWKRRLAEAEPVLAEAIAVERLAAERLQAAEVEAINA